MFGLPLNLTRLMQNQPDLSVHQLAMICRSDDSHFLKVFNEEEDLTIGEVYRIADYFDVSLDYLFGRSL